MNILKSVPLEIRATVSLYQFWFLLRLFVQRYVLCQSIARQQYHVADVTNPRLLHWQLLMHGFQPNYFALVDQGELYNLRRLVCWSGKLYQEHVRIFPDELRAHFEIAYDYGLGDAIEHVRGTTITEVAPTTVQELLDCIAEPVDLLSLET
jgi:hypothetical protein